jgi:lysophospholipase L1-like esterase
MTTSETATSGTRTSSKPRRRGRQWIFGLSTALLILALQEIAFRVIFPIPETTRFNRIRYQLLAESDPRFRPLLKRGLAYDSLIFESAPDGWRHVHRLNRFGFREKDFSIDPPAGKNRVLVVGDSVTEGQGAAASETITAQLGRDLGSGFEVLNLGVVAATMDHVSQLACDAVAVLKPATLVVVMYANDTPAPPVPPNVGGLRYLVDGIEKDRAAASSRTFLPRSLALILRVAADEPIYKRFIGQPIRYFAPTPDPTNPFREGAPPLPSLKPELETAMRAGQLNPWLMQQSEAMPGMIKADFAMGGSPEMQLRAIRQVCDQAKVRLVVAYVPFHGTVHGRYAQPLKDLAMPAEVADALATDPAYGVQSPQIRAICERLKVPFVDTTGALKAKENAGEPQYWPYDSHPRPVGYATIAESISAVLKRE